jgi:hypothetical protein
LVNANRRAVVRCLTWRCFEGLVGGGDESASWVRLRHANVGDFQLDVELVAGTGRGGPGELN